MLRASLYLTAFGSSILISRVLGPVGRGAYYLPVVTAATLVSFCGLGLEQANVFLLGNRRLTLDRLWAQSGLVALTMGGCGLAAAVAAPIVLPRLYGETPLLLMLLAGLTIPITLHTHCSAGLLTLRGKVTVQFKAGLVAAAAQLILLSGLFALGRFGVPSVLLVNLITVTLTWSLIVHRGGELGTTWLRWDAELLKETLRQSLPLHLAMVALFLHLRVDMFMVKGFLGTAALGYYSLAVTLAETVQLATDSLSMAILPHQVENTLREAALVSMRGVRANLMIGAVLAGGWGLMGAPLISLVFGPQFLPAYLPLLILLPGIVCLGVQRACGGAVLRSGKPWRVATINAASLACNAALNIWLIPTLGLAGASLTSAVSYTLGASAFIAWTARLAGLRLSQAVVPRRADLESLFRGTAAVVSLIGGRGKRLPN